MIKVSIFKTTDLLNPTHGASFPALEEANQWVESCESIKAFGDFYDEYTDEMGEIVPAKEKEYEIVIEDVSAQVEQEIINQESLAYLRNTDWYVVRWYETGSDIPHEISEKRQLARQSIK